MAGYGGTSSGGYGQMLTRKTSGVGNRYEAPPPKPQQAPQPMQAPQPVGPAPVYTGRIPSGTTTPSPSMPTPSYGQMLQPQTAAPAPAPVTPGLAPPPNGGPGQMLDWWQGYKRQQGGAPVDDRKAATEGWDQGDLEYWNDLAASIRSMPDFPGKNALYNTVLSQYEMLVNMQNKQGPVDLSGYSEVADQFGSQRQRMLNDLAASGLSGGGVQAGALANLAGSQAKAQGGFVRDALEQRRREELDQMNAFLRQVFGMQQQGLDRVYAKEDEPGFWGDALGVLGGIAGAAIPGIGGGLGGAIGGLFGGGDEPQPIPPPQNQYGWSF